MTTATGPGIDMDRAFQALADAKRLGILDRLCDGEKCVCELANEEGLAQSLLSFHLKVLREAGIVRARRVGRWGFYSVDPEAIESMTGYLGRLAGARVARTRCCANPGCSCGDA